MSAPLPVLVRALAVFAMTDDQPEPKKDAAPTEADQPTVTIAVDPATNSLVIVGSPRLTDRLAALAAELEKQMPAEPSRVRIVALPTSTDAQGLSQIIQQTI